jgi:hypothetical protein
MKVAPVLAAPGVAFRVLPSSAIPRGVTTDPTYSAPQSPACVIHYARFGSRFICR